MKTNIFREQLFLRADSNYAKFMKRLIPSCDNLIGVRIPIIRKLAKKVVVENHVEILMGCDDLYFEEVMLKGLVIGNLKDVNDVVCYAKKFIPKICNWSLCDSFCAELKISRKNKELFWNFLQGYILSKNEFEVRFAIVMILFHFIEEENLQQVFNVLDNIKHEGYYVEMAIAWAVSVCFVKFENITFEYLKNNRLNDKVFNKSLQKICESKGVGEKIKNTIRNFRR